VGLHRIEFIGNLGGDPEMRFTQTGKPVTTFNVAVNDYAQKDGGQTKETAWYKVTTWDRRAESCNTALVKGSRVLVEGRPRYRTWEDQSGQKHQSVEVTASNVVFLDRKQAEGETSGSELAPDELPFE